MPDDEIYERALNGDAYERASMTMRRMFPISIGKKIRISIGTLALSTLLAPAVFVQYAVVASSDLRSETFRLSIAVLALAGILTAFLAGAVLVRQYHVVARRSLSETKARRMIRVEDLVTLFVLQGASFVAIPTALTAIGVISPPAIEALYGAGIEVYAPSPTALADARFVSALGGILAALLFGSWRIVRGRVGRL
jgi:hypothetical protein